MLVLFLKGISFVVRQILSEQLLFESCSELWVNLMHVKLKQQLFIFTWNKLDYYQVDLYA